MKVLVLLSVALLAACASNHPAVVHQPESPVEKLATDSPQSEALLLVSLADGQLVMQHVNIDADVCMKSNANPETRCFKRGEPIYDADASTIVAYHLEPKDLNLHAK